MGTSGIECEREKKGGMRITADQYRERYAKPSKYKNRKTVDGYDSRLEKKRHSELKWLEKLGVITNLQWQAPFVLQEKQKGLRAIKYIADFVYERDGKTVVEDTKGYQTEVSKLKMKLFAVKYPEIVVRIVRK
jgi:hypothetical protein